ncbi:MAG TPA: aminotransferase class IV [Acidimicrobiales bacterium]|nr:aminotransferase class IV [Acidimicrobiales bacterium]
MAELVVWIDGALVPAAQARVSAFDRGLLLGDGVFETIRAVGAVPLAARRHLARLRRSAEGVGIDLPYDEGELRAAMAAVLERMDAPEARVRITVTAGVGALGPVRDGAAPTVLVAAGVLEPPSATTAVCTVPWPSNERSPLAGVKSTSRGEGVVALAHARARGCSEALHADTAGRLCEGTASNVFLVLDGALVTPSLATGCLPGVTRELVLELTDAEEADVPMSALERASEVFLTSTGRGVQGVHRVDDRDLPAPGPRTAAARDALEALLAEDPDP